MLILKLPNLNELQFETMYLGICATNEDSDQLEWCALWIPKDPGFLQVDSKNSLD